MAISSRSYSTRISFKYQAGRNFLNQNGDLVIHPIADLNENRGEALWQALNEFDDDFVEGSRKKSFRG